MLKVVVASKSPVKIAAAERGVKMMFPTRQIEVVGFSVPSDVADQPMTEHETKQGAYNRARNVALLQPQADLWIGIEGGCGDAKDFHGHTHLDTFAWVAVMDKYNQWSEARSASFYLPEKIATLVREGMELGAADDLVFGKVNSKQETGAVGLLTDNAIPRIDFYLQAVALALIPVKNAALYAKNG